MIRRHTLIFFFVVFSTSAFAAPLSVPAPEALDTLEIVDSSAAPQSILFAEASPAVSRDPRYSLTFSPLHLVGYLTLEAMLERTLTPRFSLAGIGAWGSFSNPEVLRIYELGGQFRFYPNGQRRHAWHYGIEAFWGYVRLDFDDGDGEREFLEFTADTYVTGAGPFVGYKFTSRDRLVVEFQFGYQGLFFEDGGGVAYPILNFNLGQAF
jgi:hypothetical protein